MRPVLDADYPVPALTDREAQVLATWLDSRSKAEVAEKLRLSENTVRTHIQRVRAKYGSMGHDVSTKVLLLDRLILDGLL